MKKVELKEYLLDMVTEFYKSGKKVGYYQSKLEDCLTEKERKVTQELVKTLEKESDFILFKIVMALHEKRDD